MENQQHKMWHVECVCVCVPAGGARCWFAGCHAASAQALGGAAAGPPAAPGEPGYVPEPPSEPVSTEMTLPLPPCSHTAESGRERNGERQRKRMQLKMLCVSNSTRTFQWHPFPCIFKQDPKEPVAKFCASNTVGCRIYRHLLYFIKKRLD